MAGFQPGDQPTSLELRNALLPGTIIARGRRTTSDTASATEHGVLRLDDIPVQAGRLYEIVFHCQPNSTVNTDNIGAHVRYTTDGSIPTTSSDFIPDSVNQGELDNSTSGGSYHGVALYTPLSDLDLSLLLCVRRVGGTGSVSLFADNGGQNTVMWVIDRGIDPGDTGTDI